MKKLIVIVFVAIAAYLYINRQPVVVAPAVVAPAPIVIAARPTAPPRTTIIVAPAPNGDLKDRWKTGANAQTDLKSGPNAQTSLTEGASWK